MRAAILQTAVVALLRTYELYLIDRDGQRRFQALTSPEAEMLRGAQSILDLSSADACEVHELGRHVVTLARSGPFPSRSAGVI